MLLLAVLSLCCCAGFSLAAASGGYSGCGAVFSLWWLLLLRSTGSGACGLQYLWLLGSGRQA